MRHVHILAAALLAVIGWLAAGMTVARQETAPPPVPQSNAPPQGIDVLTRGPVNEAYAEPVASKPTPTPVISQQPPAPVPEVPPAVRPEGDNVVWIPGYWSWDAESNGFIWVSGFWRDAPTGRRWVSGYWQQVQNGWQWVPGFWGSENIDQVQYLPPPPDPVPAEPPPAPDANSVLVPGIWVWQNNNYAWRPPFYIAYQPDWTYIPPCYNYTPNGYVFVDGYWDYPLAQRGLLFAPVRIAQALLQTANWSYTPSYIVYPDALLTALFVRPSVYSYYYGDYFGTNYADQGFIQWVDYRVGRAGYDPNFAYYRSTFRNDPSWVRGITELYAGRQSGSFPRPPRTFADQGRVDASLTGQNAALLRSLHIDNARELLQVAAPVNQVRNVRADLVARAGTRTGAGGVGANEIRLHRLAADEHTQAIDSARRAGEVQQRRQQAEAQLGGPGRRGETERQARSARLDLPRTVTAARPNEGGQTPGARRTPPATPGMPQPQERPEVRDRAGASPGPRPERPVSPERPGIPERPAPPRPEIPNRPEAGPRPEPTPRPDPRAPERPEPERPERKPPR